MKKIILVSGFAAAGFLLAGFVLLGDSTPPNVTKPTPPAARQDGSAVVSARPEPPSVPDAAPPTNANSNSANVPTARHTVAATVQVDKPGKLVTINNRQYPLRQYKALMAPNDPQADQTWASNAKLNSAWDIPRGSRDTVLAVIDTGFGLKHEEFQDRWHVNSGESGATAAEQPSLKNCADRSLALAANCNLIDDDGDGLVDNETGPATYQKPSRLNCTDQQKPLNKSCNRIDDDANGFADDVTGWDFINFDNSVQAGELNPNGDGTTHGTLVAGVAAASGNNGKGIAGADWGTKILPLQALDDDSYGNTLTVGRAIYYAVEQGVDVISLSLGSDFPDSYVEEAVQAATAAGIVVVAAAGNDGCDCMVYPAHYPEVVAVGALNTSNQRASFSSWGDELDIMAPGTQITSSTWLAANQTSAYSSGVNGTSFSAPLVAGMMTRLLSQRSAAPLQLIAAVTENSNRLTIGPGATRDAYLGFGALDSHKAMQRMVSPRVTPQAYAFGPVTGKAGSYAVYQCDAGTMPSTRIYELIKADVSAFTVSHSEVAAAKSQGFTATSFAYGCVQQPHDSFAMVRTISIPKEFRNKYVR